MFDPSSIDFLRSGKINLLTWIENQSDRQFSDLPEVLFDTHGRYRTFKGNIVHDHIHSELMVERWKSLANQCNLSSLQMEYQYELARNIRCEIPPLLRRKILLDAIGILQRLRDQLNQDQDNYQREIIIQRLDKHLHKLELVKRYFNQHC